MSSIHSTRRAARLAAWLGRHTRRPSHPETPARLTSRAEALAVGLGCGPDPRR